MTINELIHTNLQSSKNKATIKLKAARIIWFLFRLQDLISAAEIFKALCQFHVASRRGCLLAMNSGRSKTETRMKRKKGRCYEEKERDGGSERASERARKREREREDGAQRHSSGTGKRHDGISEIALDIFACSMCIANPATASFCSSTIFLSSSSASSISCTSFKLWNRGMYRRHSEISDSAEDTSLLRYRFRVQVSWRKIERRVNNLIVNCAECNNIFFMVPRSRWIKSLIKLARFDNI